MSHSLVETIEEIIEEEDLSGIREIVVQCKQCGDKFSHNENTNTVEGWIKDHVRGTGHISISIGIEPDVSISDKIVGNTDVMIST